jgi:uncharacterized membrane protein
MSTYEPPAGPPADQPPTPPPPPPADGGGAPPPPPPGGGFGAPPTGPTDEWSVGNALNYGWSKFQANMKPIILASLAIFAGLLVVGVLYFIIQGAIISTAETTYNANTGEFETTGGTSFVVSLLLMAVFAGVFIIVVQVIGAMLIRAALDITEGKTLDTATIFKMPNIGPVIIAALIIGAATIVGTMLCYLPGIIVGFATQYTLYFLLDKGLAPMDAIKASVNLVKDNLGNAIIWYIVGGIVGGAGAILCGVGLLFTLPIALIGTAYTYKKFTAQPIAA